MLDVHPIHEPVHGWRDFLLHVGTITVGLLIALGLEAAVEAMHHHHLVAEARKNIRLEIEENQRDLPHNQEALRQDAVRMRENILVIRQLRDHPRSPHGTLHYTVSWSSFPDAAFRSARDSGALSYMPHDELQRLSAVYGQQSYINGLGGTLFTDQAKAPSPLAAEATIEDLQLDQLAQLMGNTTGLLSELDMLQELLPQLGAQYAAVLK